MSYKIIGLLPFLFLFSCTTSLRSGKETTEVKPTITENNVGALTPSQRNKGEKYFKDLINQPDFYYIMTKELKDKRLTSEETLEIKNVPEQVFQRLKGISTLEARYELIKNTCKEYQNKKWFYLFQQSMAENTLKNSAYKVHIEQNVEDKNTQEILSYFTNMLQESSLPDTKLLVWCLELTKTYEKKTLVKKQQNMV